MRDETDQRRGERAGKGFCYGGFGELLQGVLPGKKKFLVNLPIKTVSNVTLTLSSSQYSEKKEAQYAESYRRYSKSYKVIRNILIDLGVHSDYYLEVDSDIPIGKGLSSSTADMVASVRALADALSIAFTAEYVARMLTEIEPNDALHYEGTSIYHHTMGKLMSRFDYVPRLNILGIDLGGMIDTVQFNQKDVPIDESEMRYYGVLLEEMQKALDAEALSRVCEIATESTRLWQKVIYKPELDRVLAVMRETDALGVVNTHSGTYLGLLYGEERSDLTAVARVIERMLPGYGTRWFQTVGCGVTIPG